MGEIASRAQLRMTWVRWGLVVVPLVVLLGLVSGRMAGSGDANGWFAHLAKPAFTPPGWMFGVAWTLLYVMMAIALVIVLAARGAPGRGAAIAMFAVQFALNLAWSPVFFAGHDIHGALLLIVAIMAAALGATILFWRVRAAAGALLVPYLVWLCFAAVLNYQIGRMNPDGTRLAPGAASTQIAL